MLSYVTYKLIHLVGIFLLLSGAGGLWALAMSGSPAAGKTVRRLVLAIHGGAMLVILVGGFGMMARLQISDAWPTWIWVKLIIWLALAALPVLLRRQQKPVAIWLLLAPLLAACAAYAALFHPGQTP